MFPYQFSRFFSSLEIRRCIQAYIQRPTASRGRRQHRNVGNSLFSCHLGFFCCAFFFCCFFLLNFLETSTLYNCPDYVQAKAVRLSIRFFWVSKELKFRNQSILTFWYKYIFHRIVSWYCWSLLGMSICITTFRPMFPLFPQKKIRKSPGCMMLFGYREKEYWPETGRRSHRRCSVEKDVLKNFEIFTGNICLSLLSLQLC